MLHIDRSALAESVAAAACLVLLADCAPGGPNVDRAPSTSDSLPSWENGPAKTAIQRFVAVVTDSEAPDFVAPEERVAVFDNDGSLWSEKPMCLQLFFAIDRIRGPV
jgi:hypothetical protein